MLRPLVLGIGALALIAVLATHWFDRTLDRAVEARDEKIGAAFREACEAKLRDHYTRAEEACACAWQGFRSQETPRDIQYADDAARNAMAPKVAAEVDKCLGQVHAVLK